MRKNIVAGNWKMNCTIDEGKKLASEVINMVETEVTNDAEVVLIPPFVHITSISSLVGSVKNMSVGAQNCHQEDSGAYTGEVSVNMLSGTGATHVIVGHSERREYFGEADELLGGKVKKVLEAGLVPIFCCGESLDSREANEQESVVQSQIETALFGLSKDDITKVVIAYEPVWAIGTGKTASADQAQEMHAFIRNIISSEYDSATADAISILYGGSVKPANAEEIFSKPDVDGGLIGGASLKSRDFTDIVKAIAS